MKIRLPISPPIPYYRLKRQVSRTTCSARYLGRFVRLAICTLAAFLIWHTLIPLINEIVFPRRNVVIYAATTYFGSNITTEKALAACPEVQKYCRVVQNESEFDIADAVVFHNRGFEEVENTIENMTDNRRHGVPFVLWSQESPSNDRFTWQDGHVINWTMTYRTDADVWAPYGTMVKLESPVEVDLNAIWESKNKTATWLASNCHTRNRRLELIKQMNNSGFDTDIWGGCGKPAENCTGTGNNTSPCVLDLIKPYKFYVSIENSNCKDYVTEKFWKALNDRMTVPIVLARKYYRDLGIPDSAYIAVDDFVKFDEFIAHLKKVNRDKELYLKYHEWRKTWKVILFDDFSGWCSLCNRLQDKDYILKNPKSYSAVQSWHSHGMCDNDIAYEYF